MDFFFYLGISLLIWLSVGFVVGLKILFIDGAYRKYDKNLERYIGNKEREGDETGVAMGKMFKKNKWVLVVVCSLLGFMALYWDWTETW